MNSRGMATIAVIGIILLAGTVIVVAGSEICHSVTHFGGLID